MIKIGYRLQLYYEDGSLPTVRMYESMELALANYYLLCAYIKGQHRATHRLALARVDGIEEFPAKGLKRVEVFYTHESN